MNNTWSLQTKVIHLGLAIAISLQLLISLLMEFPDTAEKAKTLGAAFFEWHEVVGLVAVAFVVLHLLWLLKAPDTSFAALFPWRKSGRQQIMVDLKQIKAGGQLEGGPGSGSGLVSGVHGLGLLTASAMALSGFILFFLIPEGGSKLSANTEIVAEFHEIISNLMWAYVIAHVAMAIRHHLSGHSTLRDMFSFRKN